MRKFQIAGLLLSAMATTGFAQVFDCAPMTTVNTKIISIRAWGMNDCHAAMSYAAMVAENKPIREMSCSAPIKQGQAWERNCEGSGMKLHVLYAKK